MKYLLDTCVISELVKKEPHPEVIRWLDSGDEGRMYLSVVTRNVSDLVRCQARVFNPWEKPPEQ